jgi:hypothetical protein
MLSTSEKTNWNEIIKELSNVLDISETQRKEAEDRYNAVGSFLQSNNSFLANYEPEIFPQGSFSIGTIIKPLKKDEEYDIDLVCELKYPPYGLTQYNLKNMIGDRLKQSSNYYSMLEEESRRCWTLKYSVDTKFHMDVLPSIPDEYRRQLFEDVLNEEVWKNALRITDNQDTHYNSNKIDHWPKSNPKGYANWFTNQIKNFDQRKQVVAEELKMEVEEVPNWRVKTPLQRAIQIMKRHRDMMFGDDDDKPISIIITTLAARAYQQEDGDYDALMNLLANMPNFIETGYDTYGRRIRVVRNPVNPEENFADKWSENPQKERKFYDWLDKIREDFSITTSQKGLDLIAESLKPSLGNKIVTEAFKNVGENSRLKRESGGLNMAAGTGILGETGRTKVKNHNNFGGNA